MIIEFWIVLCLINSTLKSIYSTWQKIETDNHTVLQIGFVTSVSAVLFFGITGTLTNSFSRTLPEPYGIGLLVTVGILSLIGLISYIGALDSGDLSLVSPVQQTIPVWVVLFEPLFATTTWNPIILGAAALTVIGAGIVVTDPRNIRLSEITTREVFLAGIGSLSYAASSIFGRLALDHFTVLEFLFGIYGIIAIGFTAFTLIKTKSLPQKPSSSLIALGLVLGIRLGLTYWAFALATAAQVTVVLRASMLANIIIGYYVFNEKSVKRRLIGGLTIVTAITLLVIYT